MARLTPPHPAEVERRFRDLLRAGNLRQPDAVYEGEAPGELCFRWNDERVVVIIEPGPTGALDLRMDSD